MKLAVLVCLVASCSAPAAPVVPVPANPVVRQILAIANLEQLEAGAVARALGTRPGAAEQVSPYRTDQQLEPTPLFERIELVSGTDWRVVHLTLPVGSTLVLQDLQPYLLDKRYSMAPQTSHHADGISISGMNHRFALGRYDLVIDVSYRSGPGTLREQAAGALGDGIDQASADGRSDLVRSVVITTESTIPASSQTLRAFRKWAAENP
jgi:hypothetical protein